MVKFSVKQDRNVKSVRAGGYNLRVHFKNTHETAAIIKGMRIKTAINFLSDVMDKKSCVPFLRFKGGVGRTGKVKCYKVTQGRWPYKSCKYLQCLLKSLKASAKEAGLNQKKLRICHISVNRARPGRRRTYKAHGRINPYMSSPCHIQIIAKEIEDKKTIKDKTNVLLNSNRKFRLTMRRLQNIVLSKKKKDTHEYFKRV